VAPEAAPRTGVHIVATVSTRTQPFTEATIVNLGEGGIGLRIDGHDDMARLMLSAGEEVDFRFALPETGEILHTTGRVVWTTVHACGIRFSYIPDDERLALEPWMTACVEAVPGGALRASAGGVRVAVGGGAICRTAERKRPE
jgi:hypothetical protein